MQTMVRVALRRSRSRPILLPVLLAAVSVGASAAHAQPRATAIGRDTRCLLAMGALADNPKNRPMALFGVYYFAGRVMADEPGFDFSTGLKRAAAAMPASEYPAAARECAAEFTHQVQALNAAQASLAPAPPPKQQPD